MVWRLASTAVRSQRIQGQSGQKSIPLGPWPDPAAVWCRPAGQHRWEKKGPSAHLEELAYPCCLPTLGEFGKVPPRGGPGGESSAPLRIPKPKRIVAHREPQLAESRASALRSSAEDSPRGLWRSLGKRVGLTPSRVRIPYPPPGASSFRTLAGMSGEGLILFEGAGRAGGRSVQPGHVAGAAETDGPSRGSRLAGGDERLSSPA